MLPQEHTEQEQPDLLQVRLFIHESYHPSDSSRSFLSPIIPPLLSVLTLALHPFLPFFFPFLSVVSFRDDFAALACTEHFLCLEMVLSPEGKARIEACLLLLFQMIILFSLSIPSTE